MDAFGSPDIVLFEGFRLDRSGGGLFRLDHPGVVNPVPISSRALDLLSLLVERHGQLVPKNVIMKVVWPGVMVDEGNLTVQISALRRILDQNRKEGSCIQTVPGRGYRFVAAVNRRRRQPSVVSGQQFYRYPLARTFRLYRPRVPLPLQAPPRFAR